MGFVYVTVSEEDRVALLSMDDASGELAPLASFDVPGRPAPLARHPGGSFLYVGRRGDNMISSYAVEESGAISAIGEVVLRADPCYMSTGRRGRFLLSAYYGGAGVSVHRIGSNGAVQEPVVQWVDTATGAHCIQTDASNSFAFVPHIADKGPNAIYQFRFDEETGRLSPNEPAVADALDGGRPAPLLLPPQPRRALHIERAGLQRDRLCAEPRHRPAAVSADGVDAPRGLLGREQLRPDTDDALGPVPVRAQSRARQHRRLQRRRVDRAAHGHWPHADRECAARLRHRSFGAVPVCGRPRDGPRGLVLPSTRARAHSRRWTSTRWEAGPCGCS